MYMQFTQIHTLKLRKVSGSQAYVRQEYPYLAQSVSWIFKCCSLTVFLVQSTGDFTDEMLFFFNSAIAQIITLYFNYPSPPPIIDSHRHAVNRLFGEFEDKCKGAMIEMFYNKFQFLKGKQWMPYLCCYSLRRWYMNHTRYHFLPATSNTFQAWW